MKHYQANFKKIFITIIIICTFLTIASSTTYTFTGSGNWSNPARWSPSIPPNIQMPNDSIIIDGSCNFNYPSFINSANSSLIININCQLTLFQSPLVNNGTLDIYGTLIIYNNKSLENNGTIHNNRFLNVYQYATLVNNGTLTNNDVIDIFQYGSVTLNNTFINNGSLSIDQNAILINNTNFTNNANATINNYGNFSNNDTITSNSLLLNGGTLTNNVGATIYNNGNLNNYQNSIFINNGTFYNETPFTNYGSLDNYGVFDNYSSVLNKPFYSQIINHFGATFSNHGTLTNDYNRPWTNDGTLINSGSITISGILTNNGTLTSSGSLIIMSFATFTTDGTLTNTGTITNNWRLTNNGTLTSSHTLINNKTFTNNGSITNSSIMINNSNGALTNTSTHIINNNQGGTFTNSGTINNNGTLNNNFGSELSNNSGATLTQNGVLNNQSTLTNNGTISNYIYITNDGILTINGMFINQNGASLINNVDGYIYINQNGLLNISYSSFNNQGTTINNLGGNINSSGSILTNGLLIQNYGIITNTGDGQIINNSVFTNYSGGILNNQNSFNNNIDGILNNYGDLNLYATLRNYGVLSNNNVILLYSQISNYSGSINNNEGGNIKGIGHIVQFSSFVNNNLSSISPGLSPGKLRVTGNIDLGAATFHSEINGIIQGTSYDWFSVDGTVTISPNSKLLVDWGNFIPSAGDVFTIITANLINDTFLMSNIIIPPINDLDFVVGYTATTVTISVLGPLPVKLINFYGKHQGEDIMLNWQTVSEVNNHGFEILRSRDEKSWNSIGFVSGHGSSQNTHLYTFFDKDPENGVSFYRLRQIDMDGKSELSNIINVTVNDKPKIQIYPSPTQMFLHIKGLSEDTHYTIIQANGEVLQSGQISTDTPINVQNLMPGMYYLKINDQVLEIIKN